MVNYLDKVVFDANVKLEKSLYDDNLKEFKKTKDKTSLISKYKDHNLRFSLIIDKNIAIQNGDVEYVDFLDFIINEMTNEITLLNKAVNDNSIQEVLKKYTFHEKINIIFYVRPTFYDSEFEPYEILDDVTFNKLANSIIKEANEILKKYDKTLSDIKVMNVKEVYELINDNYLTLDLLYATELVSAS